MNHLLVRRAAALLATGFLLLGALTVHGLEPIPDKLVVLTFDDSKASHYNVVRPLLKRHGFGATFFVTEGFGFATNKVDYMTWQQIKELNDDGFEIGNHTRDHMGVSVKTLGRLREQVEAINARCAEHGIPKPVSFAYPGNAITPEAIPILKELGFRFARRGGAPEHPYEWGRGFAFEPGRDHPLLLPTAADARPDWTIEDFKRGVAQARDGHIAIIQFHGEPDLEHAWVHTPPERFEEYMKYLKDNQFRVIALRDLARYTDPDQAPGEVMAVVEARKTQRKEVLVEGEIVDAADGKAVPARLYVRGLDGTWHFAKSTDLRQPAVSYDRRNRNNPDAVEAHTTLPPKPFHLELLPGTYTFTVERGKEYFPETQQVKVGPGMAKVTLKLRRWVNMAERGWYSGETHNHRAPAEVPSAMLAEDLNVTLPMVDWTTSADTSPKGSKQSAKGEFPSGPIKVDATHAWCARNTEYEIFRNGKTNHMLGALVIINHRTRFDNALFPVTAIAEKAHAEGALLDLEKHNWPWSMAIVPALKIDLFELGNNHLWRVPYSVRNWAVPAPGWMGLSGSGTDTERDWILYGFQTYYALLNCGFNLRPTAGTASGAHPVPLGFSRVYVHLDGGFSYDAWMKGLAGGRSFVTTGPMIFAKAGGEWAGERFTGSTTRPLECTVRSEGPLESIELIVNGVVQQKFTPRNTRGQDGGHESVIETPFKPQGTSWIAWRCFEKRPDGRTRFAHTAPWHFEVSGKPLHPRREEIDWLISRTKEEMERSRHVMPESLVQLYEESLQIYERIRGETL